MFRSGYWKYEKCAPGQLFAQSCSPGRNKKHRHLFTFIWFRPWWATEHTPDTQCNSALIYFWHRMILYLHSVQFMFIADFLHCSSLSNLPFVALFPIRVFAPRPTRFRSSEIGFPLWSVRTPSADFRAPWNPLTAFHNEQKYQRISLLFQIKRQSHRRKLQRYKLAGFWNSKIDAYIRDPFEMNRSD